MRIGINMETKMHIDCNIKHNLENITKNIPGKKTMSIHTPVVNDTVRVSC